MNEYLFGSGPGHLGGKAARIAKKLGAVLVNYTEPNGYKCHWFATRNYGSPFNEATARAVRDELEK